MKSRQQPDPASKELQDIRHALDQSAIVAMADPRGLITYANDKFCEISGYLREELIGKNHRIVNSGHHPSEFFAEMWKTISSGKTWRGEIRNRAKDGSHYWVHTTIVPFQDEAGKVKQYISIRYPITECKEAEERLRRSNRELQEFASVAAHDLREPLRKITAFVSRIRAKTEPLLNEEIRGYFDRVQRSSERMQTLIDDLLSYSRVTTQTKPFMPVDLNQIIGEVLSDLELRIEQTRAVVEVSKLPVLEADRIQIRQLFQNLISNALKFHKPGQAPRVRITFEAGRIQVQDEGIGFDEKYLDRIFAVFQRLHGRSEYEGTGVGLAICQKIAERHGGNITARSQVGKGSTFIVHLPEKRWQKGVLN